MEQDEDKKLRAVRTWESFYTEELQNAVGIEMNSIGRLHKHIGKKATEVFLLKIQLTATHSYYKWRMKWLEFHHKTEIEELKGHANKNIFSEDEDVPLAIQYAMELRGFKFNNKVGSVLAPIYEKDKFYIQISADGKNNVFGLAHFNEYTLLKVFNNIDELDSIIDYFFGNEIKHVQ